ncbi:hypothetical protein [Pseudosulfitobacter pseudonitzschiae]|uniref:hypothetical protein n=1 Tax=Pseudosulfitobacter pseudonitzschiae TaxID=1402135 RepID=UPI003B828DA1
MTFDLNATENLDYDTAKDFIDMVKPGWHVLQPKHVLAVRPDFTIGQVNSFLKSLNRAGLIELVDASERGLNYFEITDRGMSLVDSKLKARMTPEQAKECYAKVLATVADWNADPEKPVTLTSVRLFGSYLEDRSDYGDVDIAISTDLRPEARTSIEDRYGEVPESRKRYIYLEPNEILMSSVVQRYWLDKAITRIQRVCPGAAVTTSDIVDDLGCEYREVQKYSPSSGKQLAAENVTHGRTRERDVPEPPELYTGEVLIVPLEATGAKTASQHMEFDTKSMEFLIENLYAWPLRDSSSRPSFCFDYLIEGENFPAWKLEAETSFDKLREITRKAEELGLVSFPQIDINVSNNSVRLTFEIGDEEASGLISQAIFDLTKRGNSYTIDIRPEVYNNDVDLLSGKSTLGGHYMAMARSLFSPMKEVLELAKFPKGVEGYFTFMWNADGDDPVFPDLRKLAVSLKGMKPAIDASDLSDLYEEVRRSNKERRDLRVSSDCRIHVDEDGSSLTRKATAFNSMYQQAEGTFPDHDALRDHEDLIAEIIESYDMPSLQMSVRKMERLNLNEPENSSIEDFMERIDVIASPDVDSQEIGPSL